MYSPSSSDSSNYVYGSNVLDKKANNSAVNHLYQQYFGRDATQAELNNWGERGGRDTTVRALEDFLQREQTRYYQDPEVEASVEPGPGDELTGVYKELYDAARGFLDEIKSRGQTVNPEVEITPKKVAEFMKNAETNLDTFLPYAEKEILPYYETQFKLAREGFLRSVGFSQEEVLQQENDLERQYGRAVRGIGESAAQVGFAQSGKRLREERELGEDTQRALESGRRQFGFGAETAARDFARQFGTKQLPSFEIDETPQVRAGEKQFGRTGRKLPLYELSDETYQGLIGEREFEKEAAVRSRAAELEGAFRANDALADQRRLLY